MVTTPREIVNYMQAGFYVVSEEIYLSREQVMLQGDGLVVSGTVLGHIRVGDITAAAKAGGNTGDGAAPAVTPKTGAKPGVYRVDFTAATKFDVFDPEGFQIKSGTVGAAYNDDIGFTIAAGGTPFVAGDAFDITVEAVDGEYGALDFTANNGLQEASAILWESRSPAEDAPVRCVITAREAEVHDAVLTWPAGMTVQQKQTAQAQLAARHIILR